MKKSSVFRFRYTCWIKYVRSDDSDYWFMYTDDHDFKIRMEILSKYRKLEDKYRKLEDIHE